MKATGNSTSSMKYDAESNCLTAKLYTRAQNFSHAFSTQLLEQTYIEPSWADPVGKESKRQSHCYKFLKHCSSLLSFLYRKRLEAKMPAAFPRWVRMGLQKDTGQCSFSGDWTNARFTEGSPNVHWRFTEGSPGRVSWLSDAPSTNPASLLTACHSKVFVWFPHILSSISWDRDYTTQTTWKLSGPFVKHCFCEFDLKHAKPHTFTYLNLSKQRCSQCRHSIVSNIETIENSRRGHGTGNRQWP